MTKSTIDRKYTKSNLAEMLEVEVDAFSKSQLVDMYSDSIEKADADVDVAAKAITDTFDAMKKDGSAVGISMKDKALADLDNALEVVLKEGILYRIDSHCWWGKTSKVPEDQIKAPKKILTGVKTLIDPKHLGPFRAWKGAGERIVKKLGYQFLGLRGVYFVPKGFIQTAEAKLKECQDAAMIEKKVFADGYERFKQEWKDEVLAICKEEGIDESIALEYMKDAYYPTAGQLDGKFVFKWTKFMISVPDSNMGILTDKEYQEEVRKQKVQAKEFLENCVAELAQKFYEIISKINDKLAKGEVIKPKTLQSLTSFTEVFDKMNITGNASLAGYVDEARKLFSGVSVKDFKEEVFATKLSDKLDKVVTQFKDESDQALLRDIEF